MLTTREEIDELTSNDILDYNFLQNFLTLIDNDEFILNTDMLTQENLINHIIYQLKMYLRKRNFNPTRLLDGLKKQLLDEVDKEEGYNKTSMLSFHHGFDDKDQHIQMMNSLK